MPTLITLGFDSSGRAIRATPYEAAWIDAFAEACETRCPEPFTPVIVQGPWQSLNGGGADESADTHEEAGCLDYRTWNLTTVQKQFLIREARRMACAMYLRVPPAFDEHAHGIIGGAGPKSLGAAAQWQEYLDGGDGLVGNVPDNRWRPTPLVTTWRPPPAPTVNITAALTAKTPEARKRSLRRVIRSGKAPARAAAETWLKWLLAKEAAVAKAKKARGELKAEQVR